MAQVRSRQSGFRALLTAGEQLLWGPAFTRSSRKVQRHVFDPQRGIGHSEAGSVAARAAALAQKHQEEEQRLFSDRQPNMNLIYRDVKAFLRELGGNPREARYWLTQFQRASAAKSPAFAVLEV